MFTQCSLSLGSSNYTFKIKLNNKAIDFLTNNKSKLNAYKKTVGSDTMQDQYEGELIGMAYTNVSSDTMLKELGRWKKFFEANNIEVYDAKVLSLKDRLKELEKLNQENRNLILKIEGSS